MANQQQTEPVVYAAISDRGRIRQENQDNLYCAGNYNTRVDSGQQYRYDGLIQGDAFFAVADGMGGEANGSEIAFALVRGLGTLSSPVTNELLADYLLNFNFDVCNLIEQHNGKRMGSTFASLSIHNGIAEMTNIGDSRIYLLREERLQCVSKDDTVVRPLIEKGLLSSEQARKHPERHRLTQHIGVFPDELLIEPHTDLFTVKRGDVFLICSDGLTDALDDGTIFVILSQKTEVIQKADELFKKAYFNTRDNITIIVVEIA